MILVPLALLGCSGDGQSTPTNPPATADPPATAVSVATSPSSTAVPGDVVVPVGFEQVALTVTNADGVVCTLCLWRAETAAQRRQGMMGVTDLGGADGMVFVYADPVVNQFWMSGTPMALDIAWFDTAGALVSTARMKPCLSGPLEACARYAAAGAYTLAVELPAGRLEELGIGAGSVATLGVEIGCDTP